VHEVSPLLHASLELLDPFTVRRVQKAKNVRNCHEAVHVTTCLVCRLYHRPQLLHVLWGNLCRVHLQKRGARQLNGADFSDWSSMLPVRVAVGHAFPHSSLQRVHTLPMTHQTFKYPPLRTSTRTAAHLCL
jgi:hypothetical protein